LKQADNCLMMVSPDLAMCADSVNISRNARMLGIFNFGLLLPPSPTQRFLLFDPLRAVIVGTFNFLSPGPVSHVAMYRRNPLL